MINHTRNAANVAACSGRGSAPTYSLSVTREISGARHTSGELSAVGSDAGETAVEGRHRLTAL